MKLTSSSYNREKGLGLTQKERDTVIAIIGKSGSGKSEIAKRYFEKGYNVIQSYTDRPQRYDKEWGHIFIASEEVEQYKTNMIAYTFFDGYHYFATRDQYQGKGITFYVIDPYGVKALKDKVKDAELIFIYIDVDENIRIDRMVKRLQIKSPDASAEMVQAFYEKARSRAEYDKKAFAVVECDYVIDNNGSFENTLEIIDRILPLSNKNNLNN